MHTALMINYKALLIEDVVRYVSGHLIIFFCTDTYRESSIKGGGGVSTPFFWRGKRLNRDLGRIEGTYLI